MAGRSKVTENFFKQMAESVLDSRVWPYINQFVSTATKNEIKGLKIVASIHKHQGKKKFRPSSKPSEPSFKNTIDILKTKYLQSYYNSEYCKDSGPETDIFKYKALAELKCSEVLTPECLQNVQNWLNLKDEIRYQELLLSFLRGVFSVFRTQEAVPSSSHRESYGWVKSAGKSESPLKPIVGKISLPKVNTSQKRSESTGERMNEQARKISYESPKLTALRNLKGSGEIMSWISNIHGRNSSLYQDSFIPLYYQKANKSKNDFNTSVVFKLLPDRS